MAGSPRRLFRLLWCASRLIETRWRTPGLSTICHLPFTIRAQRGRMPRLVQLHFEPARQLQRHDDAVALVSRLARHLDPLRAQVANRRVDVVAHQLELMADARGGRRALGGVNAQLRGRKLEDEPAVAGIDVLPAEDVAEDGADLLGLRGV